MADLRRTIDFNANVLGFYLGVLWPDHDPTFCVLHRDGVRLAFDRAEVSQGTVRLESAGFYIEGDVRPVHEALRGRVQVEWGPEVYHYGRREFAIRDPDGYLIIFTELTDDPPTCPEEGTARSFQCDSGVRSGRRIQ